MTAYFVPETAGRRDWYRLAARAINYLLRRDAMRGSKDTANSSTTPLGISETFTGEWVANDDPHLAYNVLTDEPGTIYVEFSIDGTTALQSLTKAYQVFADDPQFDALVKMPGRYHRVRYVNGGTAQAKFGLITATGPDLYPYAVSDRDAPRFAACSGANTSSTDYQILVDLDNRADYPHHFTGRVDLYGTFFSVDKTGTAQGFVRIGVITRIDGTDADIAYVQGIGFDKSSNDTITRDRMFVNPIPLGQSGGVLTGAATAFKSTGVTAVNTGATLSNSVGGTSTPAVGDVIALFEHTSGSAYNASISCQYATSTSST